MRSRRLTESEAVEYKEMPFEHALWRIDTGLNRLSSAVLENESLLEECIHSDIRILNDGWLVIGRQIRTDHGGIIDLLAIDNSGALVVIELKRNLTPRDVVAQAIDYAAWIQSLSSDVIAGVFDRYTTAYKPELKQKTLDEAFKDRFGIELAAEDLNQAHQIVVVAARLDPSTERIVNYLAGRGIEINVVFFQVFADADRRILSRVWFIDPTEVMAQTPDSSSKSREWNGEYYVSFGVDESQDWGDAVEYGFISASGGRWYTNTLALLSPGDRVFVNVPGHGYVGVGIVEQSVVPISDFRVKLKDAADVPILEARLRARNMGMHLDDPDKMAYLVRVRWLKTVPLEHAIHEVGFFGNQNSVCKPKAAKWTHTVDRLKQLFPVSDTASGVSL
jgi:hypothetical protein